MPLSSPVGLGLVSPITGMPLALSAAMNGQALASGASGQFLIDVGFLELSNAQILALPGAATTVIGTITAPAGFAMLPMYWLLEEMTQAGAYGAANCVLGLRYKDTNTIGPYFTHPRNTGASPARHYITGGAPSSTLNIAFNSWTAPETAYVAAASGLDIVATIAGGAFTGGNIANYWRMWITYFLFNSTAALR